MRAMWKGALSFGLLSLEVAMYAAVDERSTGMKTAHAECGGSISHKKWCAECDTEVSVNDIVRRVEVLDGTVPGDVLISDEERAKLKVSKERAIEVASFVPADDVDVMLLSKPYYLEPRGVAKPYAVMARAMAAAGVVGVGRVTIRQREQPVLVRPVGDALVAQTMAWPAELRAAPEGVRRATEAAVSDAELDMAGQLVSQLTRPFDAQMLTDRYAEGLRELVAEKVAAGHMRAVPVTGDHRPAVEKMAWALAALSATPERAA